ncbi:MAG TPA: BON domain-containing protein [Candidatus Margulisiibacteriota bacterium]|nr:BON domain-containing protein [Candidatus Margulisiibacteriota bacterium]
MSLRERVLHEVRTSFHSEPRFGPHGRVELDFSDGDLTIEGEVRTVAVKKLLLERAAAHPAVAGIVDRLHVIPLQAMGDSQIRHLVRDALLEESALAEVAIREVVKGETLTVREPPDPCRGDICIEVGDGIVTLDGTVPSLAHKRLAGVLAWWVPGSRDVINGLDVFPPEQDNDEEITDAVRMALEKDPFVDASQISVATKECVVTLEGVVPKEAEREMAESDAWYVFGVDRVENHIMVHPAEPTGRYG